MGERTYWERHAGNYERSMRLLGGPVQLAAERAARAVAGRERVLELAAGTGLVTEAIARTAGAVVATDYAQAMVDALAARARAAGLDNVRCERADIYDLPYPPGHFDAVVAANVLHLLPDLPTALRAMRQVARPGARWVLPTFCHDETAVSWMLSRALALIGFPSRRRFTLRTLGQTLDEAGLVTEPLELLPGPIPIGYAEGTFGAEDPPDVDREV